MSACRVAGPLVTWSTGEPGRKEAVDMPKGDPITWRFEVQRCDGAEWMPLDSELLREDDLWDDHIGTHDMPECWDDPLEFARNELESVLGRLVADCRQLGVTQARIVLWTRETAEGDPAI